MALLSIFHTHIQLTMDSSLSNQPWRCSIRSSTSNFLLSIGLVGDPHCVGVWSISLYWFLLTLCISPPPLAECKSFVYHQKQQICLLLWGVWWLGGRKLFKKCNPKSRKMVIRPNLAFFFKSVSIHFGKEYSGFLQIKSIKI